MHAIIYFDSNGNHHHNHLTSEDIPQALEDQPGSVINHRMNDTVKTFTVITTMFMPISFVAGFFGINFFEPVLSTSTWTGASSLVFTLLLMVAAPSLLYLYIRKRGWM